MFWGCGSTRSVVSRGFYPALSGYASPVEALVQGRVLMPRGARQIVVLCPGVHRVGRALGVELQSVCGLLCRAVGEDRVGGGEGVL